MLSVKHISEFSEAEQAALPPEMRRTTSIIIRESFPGEGREPRIFFRRAIYALKGKTAARRVEIACLKAFALLETGLGVAVSVGGFSRIGRYDPLPDLRELQQRAERLKPRPGGEGYPARRFRNFLGGWVRLLEQYSEAERVGA